MKRFLITLFLILVTLPGFCQEEIAGFEDKDLPVLNEELRSVNASQDIVEEDLATVQTSVTAAEADIVALEGFKKRVQQVHDSDNTKSQISAGMVLDDTIPQNNEGGEVITLAITPTVATNILEIDIELNYEDNNGYIQCVALFQDDTADALKSWITGQPKPVASYFFPNSYHFKYRMVAGTTSATTFKVRVGPVNHGVEGKGTLTLNGLQNIRYFGGTLENSITITEYEV